MDQSGKLNISYCPIGAPGEGEYGKNAGSLLRTRIEPIKTLLVETARNIPLMDKVDVFCIGDYGAADGTASFAWMSDVLTALKQRHGPGLEIQVIYEDQPINDFNSLFKRLSGIIPDPPSYLDDFENVFTFATGISFYQRCAPTESMHLIFSAIAVNNLALEGPKYKDSVYKFSKEQASEAKDFKRRAAQDWELLLTLRSAELKEGGALVIISLPGSNKDLPGYKFDPLLGILDDLWKDMKDEKLISVEEWSSANKASYYRTQEEIRAPFDDPESPVSKSGLRLKMLKKYTIPCPYHKAWKEKLDMTGVDDREEYSNQIVSNHKRWSHGIFLSALSGCRSQADRQSLVDDLYLRLQKRVSTFRPGELIHEEHYMYICAEKQTKRT